MSTEFYLPRKLLHESKTWSEAELLSHAKGIIVLAEPGAGKTTLLGYFAKQLGISSVPANVFVHRVIESKNQALVVDAFDELAKVNNDGINILLGKISSLNPSHIIISSRSSEWSDANTYAFKDFFGYLPLIVRLHPFDISEQQRLFQNYKPEEDFEAFYDEVGRFDLEDLLANPHFLKMFANAYVESARRFSNKQSIFEKAIIGLAREFNESIRPHSHALPLEQKVNIASEVFAKQLLAGAEGISVNEYAESRSFPSLLSLLDGNSSGLQILSTKLFRPAAIDSHHIPMHKMVAEYCAARYLIGRILNQQDPLELAQCLTIIAPNTIVRDDLRGLLGWMATQGNESIQRAVIELDPYTVLANGDPSQLTLSSKRLLLLKLKELEKEDPYFRRTDVWRQFSVSDLFTKDVVEHVKELIVSNSNGHLRNLLLELLVNSSILPLLTNELKQITLDQNANQHTRIYAAKCLFKVENFNHDDWISTLIAESSLTSLKVLARSVLNFTPEVFTPNLLEKFFRACVILYPSREDRVRRTIGERYFIKEVINKLSPEFIESLLDALTSNLQCTCGKGIYRCRCLEGISKIVGLLLDRYFTVAQSPFDPVRTWAWVKNLRYYDNYSHNTNTSVQVLNDNTELRQGLLRHIFEDIADQEQSKDSQYKFRLHIHSGLILTEVDRDFLVDLAFETDNPNVWASFFAHDRKVFNGEDKGKYPLRRKMRQHALEKPDFMRFWITSNRNSLRIIKESSKAMRPHKRWMKQDKRRKESVKAKNLSYFLENKELIESGRHWGLLRHFAELTLFHPEEIVENYGTEECVKNALRNCLDFIAPHIPDLASLSETHSSSKRLHVEDILLASAIEIMRENGHINVISFEALKVLKIVLHRRCNNSQDTICHALEDEVNSLLFKTPSAAERFLREYLEPQLAHLTFAHQEIGLLQYDKLFSRLKRELSVEWLERFEHLSLEKQGTLFDMATEFGDIDKLKDIILARCQKLLHENYEDFEDQCDFWFLRAFYFLDLNIALPFFRILKSTPNSLLLFEGPTGRMWREEYVLWPQLTPCKIECILDAFWDCWPQVPLPSSWGTGSPVEEQAYRCLVNLAWSMGKFSSDEAVNVLARLIENEKYRSIHSDLKSLRAGCLRQNALKDFEPPTPYDVVRMLDGQEVVTVEGLRQLIVDELQAYQGDITGNAFNTFKQFYKNDAHDERQHIDENRASEIIAHHLKSVLEPKNISIALEYLTKDRKRADIAAIKMFNGVKKILMIEVKGQWHKDLYTAATTQLSERYLIHPNAERQGLFLVLWFGAEEKVANCKSHNITTADELKTSIENHIPSEIKGLIDVFVLDVSA